MAELVDQARHDAPHRLGAEAPAAQLRVEEDVDPGVAEVRLGLLPELDQPGDRAVHLDREPRRARLVLEREALGRVVPEAPHLGQPVDPEQLVRVRGLDRAQHEAGGIYTPGYHWKNRVPFTHEPESTFFVPLPRLWQRQPAGPPRSG